MWTRITPNTGTFYAVEVSHYSLNHCVKSVQIQGFFWSVFSCIWTDYVDLLSKWPYSVGIEENTDQKKVSIWTLFTQ